MRKFDYRAPRFPVDLDIRVTTKDAVHVGRCTEISTEGMRFESIQPLGVDTFGVIEVTSQGTTLEIPARVIHCGNGCEGLQYLCASDEQRDEIVRFVDMLAESSSPSTPRSATLSVVR